MSYKYMQLAGYMPSQLTMGQTRREWLGQWWAPKLPERFHIPLGLSGLQRLYTSSSAHRALYVPGFLSCAALRGFPYFRGLFRA
jgi:hypothetical protein